MKLRIGRAIVVNGLVSINLLKLSIMSNFFILLIFRILIQPTNEKVHKIFILILFHLLKNILFICPIIQK